MFIRRELGGTGAGCLFQFTYCVNVLMRVELTKVSRGHVASNTHNGLAHFNGLDIVIVGISGGSLSVVSQEPSMMPHTKKRLGQTKVTRIAAVAHLSFFILDTRKPIFWQTVKTWAQNYNASLKLMKT